MNVNRKRVRCCQNEHGNILQIFIWNVQPVQLELTMQPPSKVMSELQNFPKPTRNSHDNITFSWLLEFSWIFQQETNNITVPALQEKLSLAQGFCHWTCQSLTLNKNRISSELFGADFFGWRAVRIAFRAVEADLLMEKERRIYQLVWSSSPHQGTNYWKSWATRCLIHVLPSS